MQAFGGLHIGLMASRSVWSGERWCSSICSAARTRSRNFLRQLLSRHEVPTRRFKVLRSPLSRRAVTLVQSRRVFLDRGLVPRGAAPWLPSATSFIRVLWIAADSVFITTLVDPPAGLRGAATQVSRCNPRPGCSVSRSISLVQLLWPAVRLSAPPSQVRGLVGPVSRARLSTVRACR